MIAGNKYNGLLVDIWSTGVILYAMLCGYLPFEDPNTAGVYKKILKGEFELPDFLSEDAKDLLKKILNKDPNKRYRIKDIKSHPWFSLVKPSNPDEGVVTGYNQIPIDLSILSELKGFKIDPDYAKQCLETNRHNEITVTYYLLVKKYQREGKKTVINPNSSLCVQQNPLQKKTQISQRKNSAFDWVIHSGRLIQDSTDSYKNSLDKGMFEGKKSVCLNNYESDSEQRNFMKEHKLQNNNGRYSNRTERLAANWQIIKCNRPILTRKRQGIKSYDLPIAEQSIPKITSQKKKLSFETLLESFGSYKTNKTLPPHTKTYQAENTIYIRTSKMLKNSKKILHPPINAKIASKAFLLRKNSGKEYSPYAVKLNTCVRPVTRSQAGKKLTMKTVRKNVISRNEEEIDQIFIKNGTTFSDYGETSLRQIKDANRPLLTQFKSRKASCRIKDKRNTCNLSFG